MTGRTIRLWLICATVQLVADGGFFWALRSFRQEQPWAAVPVTQPIPDSLRLRVSRYLHDSLGVVTERAGDTLVVRVPPDAERSLEARVTSLQRSSRRLGLWFLGAVVLLHLPVLIAIIVTIGWMADRELRTRNRALDSWEDS